MDSVRRVVVVVLGDGAVVVQVLSGWGVCAACPEDLTGEGTVDFADLLEVLSSFGPC